MYEFGLAVSMGKEVILLSEKSQDVPFDIRGHRVLMYDKNNLNELLVRLTETFRHYKRRSVVHNS